MIDRAMFDVSRRDPGRIIFCRLLCMAADEVGAAVRPCPLQEDFLFYPPAIYDEDDPRVLAL